MRQVLRLAVQIELAKLSERFFFVFAGILFLEFVIYYHINSSLKLQGNSINEYCIMI